MSRFSLGSISLSPAVAALIEQDSVARALEWHSSGEWGDVSEARRQENERALSKKAAVVSEYPIGQERLIVQTDLRDNTTYVELYDEDGLEDRLDSIDDLLEKYGKKTPR